MWFVIVKLKMAASFIFLLVIANAISVTDEFKMISQIGWKKEGKLKTTGHACGRFFKNRSSCPANTVF